KSIEEEERFLNSRRSFIDSEERFSSSELFKIKEWKIELEKGLYNLKNLKEYHSYLKQHLDSLTLNRTTPKLTNYKPNVNQFTFLQNWDNLKKGKGYRQVLKILGIPTKIEYPELEIINYSNLHYF